MDSSTLNKIGHLHDRERLLTFSNRQCSYCEVKKSTLLENGEDVLRHLMECTKHFQADTGNDLLDMVVNKLRFDSYRYGGGRHKGLPIDVLVDELVNSPEKFVEKDVRNMIELLVEHGYLLTEQWWMPDVPTVAFAFEHETDSDDDMMEIEYRNIGKNNCESPMVERSDKVIHHAAKIDEKNEDEEEIVDEIDDDSITAPWEETVIDWKQRHSHEWAEVCEWWMVNTIIDYILEQCKHKKEGVRKKDLIEYTKARRKKRGHKPPTDNDIIDCIDTLMREGWIYSTFEIDLLAAEKKPKRSVIRY